MYRAAVISNSNQSIISNYLNNTESLNRSLYDLLNSLPYLRANQQVNEQPFLDESYVSKQKASLKSVSSYELNALNLCKEKTQSLNSKLDKLTKLNRSLPNIHCISYQEEKLSKSLVSFFK